MRRRNPNYDFLRTKLDREQARGIVLEGGSRSGKTWSVIYYLIRLCAAGDNLVINVVKETFAGFKTTLYSDFTRILTPEPINEPNPFGNVQNIQTYHFHGSRFNFIGADQASKFHGAACDYFWINEALDVDQSIFDQLEMRCRKAWIMDYNPKVSGHWIFDKVLKRSDVAFLKTTMLDNPYIGEWERKKILSYEPTPGNIAAGTADDYMWKVYGLGERCAQSGLIFPYVNWIDRFPEDVDRHWFGLDFGYTVDPTALVRIASNGTNLYLKEELYEPIDSADVLYSIIAPVVGQNIIWCDSADPGMIKDLQRKGLRAFSVKKFPGSIQHGIDVMKRFTLNIVSSPNFPKEQAKYAWRTIQGIQVNEPIDQYNHLWDASRYGSQMELSKRAGFTV
jgi:PBSX family phage terminase large subunit